MAADSKALLVLAAALAGAVACSSETNILGLVTPQAQRETYASLLSTARAAYDSGDLPRALKLSRAAHELDPDGEQAAILYGFVNLSLAHADPYSLAGGLAGYDKSKGVAPLTALKTVIGLTDPELRELGTVDTSDPELPVIVPGCVESVRLTAERLSRLNEAINAACPFVPVGVRVADDIRQRCGLEPARYIQEEPFQVLFLWSFAHLSEALAFNGVLTYGSADPSGQKTNLELRVEKIRAIDTSDPANLPTFLRAFDGLKTTLDAVMPTSGRCSDAAPTTQLTATLNDLLAVDNGFGAMPGIPASITKSIRDAVGRIKEIQASAASASGTTSDGQKAASLKADLNKKIAEGLAAKLDELGQQQGTQVTPAQKSQVCAAYASISAGGGPAPGLCNGVAAAFTEGTSDRRR